MTSISISSREASREASWGDGRNRACWKCKRKTTKVFCHHHNVSSNSNSKKSHRPQPNSKQQANFSSPHLAPICKESRHLPYASSHSHSNSSRWCSHAIVMVCLNQAVGVVTNRLRKDRLMSNSCWIDPKEVVPAITKKPVRFRNTHHPRLESILLLASLMLRLLILNLNIVGTINSKLRRVVFKLRNRENHSWRSSQWRPEWLVSNRSLTVFRTNRKIICKCSQKPRIRRIMRSHPCTTRLQLNRCPPTTISKVGQCSNDRAKVANSTDHREHQQLKTTVLVDWAIQVTTNRRRFKTYWDLSKINNNSNTNSHRIKDQPTSSRSFTDMPRCSDVLIVYESS